MDKKSAISFYGIILVALALQGCSGGVGQAIGLGKDSPDEFSVLTRAPLEMPKTTDLLPPPRLGAPRPQEKSAVDLAEKAMFGGVRKSTDNISYSENALLQKAGSSDAGIRGTVNKETAQLRDRNKPVAEKLFNVTGNNKRPSATIVDAEKELLRIQNNKKNGRNITDGVTPIIEE